MREKLKSLDRNVITLVIISVLVIAGLAYASNGNDENEIASTANAQEAEEQSDHEHEDGDDQEHEEDASNEESTNTDESADSSEGTDGQYSYTAQAGDSYTKIARKAVQTYGIINDVSLSEAQIVAAETRLTQEAKEPALNVGQEVHITADTVKQAVEYAESLSEEDQAEWEVYAKYVDFNTDNVGEERS